MSNYKDFKDEDMGNQNINLGNDQPANKNVSSDETNQKSYTQVGLIICFL